MVKFYHGSDFFQLKENREWCFFRLGQFTSGVPQGTVLGPLLFLLYVNDLDSVVKHSTVKLFADDVLLYAPANTIKDCSALQDDLSAIACWANCWKLKLKSTKCEALMMT